MTNSTQSFIHDPHTTISNENIFLQYILAIPQCLELLEMLPLYYIDSYMFAIFDSSSAHITRRENRCHFYT